MHNYDDISKLGRDGHSSKQIVVGQNIYIKGTVSENLDDPTWQCLIYNGTLKSFE